MGEGLVRICKEKLSKEAKLAFCFTFFATLFIHLYQFANGIPNHDALFNSYSDQNMLGSGRWALSWACGMSSYYDLPWVIGLLSCVWLALTAVVVVAIFEIKNPVLICLTGGLLSAAPAITETFFFLYTADGYLLAMLLAALGVYGSRIGQNRKIGLLLSGICICVSCGIYQAYVSFGLLLAVCYFLDGLLQDCWDWKTCRGWIIRQILLYGLALAAYYGIWKLLLWQTGMAASTYQGISQVGTISVGQLLHGAVESVRAVMMYFLQWNVLEHGFTCYNMLSSVFLVAFLGGLLISCIRSNLLRRPWAAGLVVLCLFAIIPFAGTWTFTSSDVQYGARMLQSLTLLFVLAGVLYERWCRPVMKNAMALLLLITVLHNGLLANISYFYLARCYERSYAEGIQMVLELNSIQENVGFNQVAVVGSRIFEVQLQEFDPETGTRLPSGRIHYLNGTLETCLLYDSLHTRWFLSNYFGVELGNIYSVDQRNALLDTPQVQAMPCWPDQGSMAVVDDTLVIKMSDQKE